MLSCLTNIRSKASLAVAFAAMSLLATTARSQPQITFTFDNVEFVTIDGDSFIEFDIMVASSQAATLGDLLVYLNYSEASFGQTIAARGDVVITPGELTKNDLVYGIAVTDNFSEGDGKISIFSEYRHEPESEYASRLSSTPKSVYHVRMRAIEEAEVRLSFDNDCSAGPCMEGEQYQTDRTPFGSVVAEAEFFAMTPTAIGERAPDSVIKENLLSPAYPNPFNPQTNFSVGVVEPQHVSVAVYNMLGQRVAMLHDGWMAGGRRQDFTFEAMGLPSGAYFIHVTGQSITKTQQVVLLK